MFRYLVAGLCLGLILRLGAEPFMLAGLILALPAKFLPGRPRVLEWTFIIIASIVGFTAAGKIDAQDLHEGRIQGIWRFTSIVKKGMFAGRMAGGGDLIVRGAGKSLPVQGSALEGTGRFLESSAFRSPEFRLDRWKGEDFESSLERQSRLGRLSGRSRILFPLTVQYSPECRPLARALLFGDKRALPGSLRRSFRDAGLAHLLALSGLHVGLFLLLLRRITIPMLGRPSRAEWILLPLLPFLPAWGGGGASINRASFMAGYLLVGRRLGGRPLGIEALAFAAFAELALRPASLFEPGFQLSYLATAALLAFPGRKAPLGAKSVHKLLHYYREGVAVSTLCTLATLPVILSRFDRLPLGGPIWNLLAAPLTAASLFSGWSLLPLGLIPASSVIPDFFFARLIDLATLAGSKWRLLLTGFSAPAWTWLAWGLGMRGILKNRRKSAWYLAAIPALAGWILGSRAFHWGPPSF